MLLTPKYLLLVVLFGFFFALSVSAQKKTINSNPPTVTLALNEILDMALQKSEGLKSINKSIEALENEIRARDITLSPILTADIFSYKDLRQAALGLPVRDAISSGFDLSLVKPFSAGTTLSLGASHDLLGRDGITARQDTATWEIKLSQSLWKNAFGRSTDLRHSAERYELLSRKNALEYEKNLLMTNVEGAYWDLVLSEKELALREANVNLGTLLVQWTQKRQKLFAAENSDLLQVQSLLAQRKLSLLVAQNNLSSSQSVLKQYIPSLNLTGLKINIDDLNKNTAMTLPQKNESPLRFDAIAAINKALQVQYESERIYDSNRPDLDLYASYASNGVSDQFNSAWEKSGEDHYSQKKIGVVFSINLDSNVKRAQRNSAQLNYESLKIKADGLQRASKISWTDLVKNITQLKEQIKVAQELTKIQNNKVTAERHRYRQGRTTTLQMTAFEIEATESELTYYRLLISLKKAESQLRLYAYTGNTGQTP